MSLWINFQKLWFVKFKFKFILSRLDKILICLPFVYVVQHEEYLDNEAYTFIY